MGVDRRIDAAAEPDWQTARDGECAFVYRLDGLPMAFHAEGVSTVLDGAEIFLPLAQRRASGSEP